MKTMFKTVIAVLLLVMIANVNIHAGEWANAMLVVNACERASKAEFKELVADARSDALENGAREISKKAASEVIQRVFDEYNLTRYDFDVVGFVFELHAEIESRMYADSNKKMFVLLRITKINRNGTFNYDCYAWEID